MKQERDRMQNDFDGLMRQPFFREQADNANLVDLERKQSALDQREREILKMQSNIQKYGIETQQNVEKFRVVQDERDTFQEDLSKMKVHMDPSSISLNDIMKKLRTEDPSNFRQVMSDLEYQGKDPNWYK